MQTASTITMYCIFLSRDVHFAVARAIAGAGAFSVSSCDENAGPTTGRLGPDLAPTWPRLGPDLAPTWGRPRADFFAFSPDHLHRKCGRRGEASGMTTKRASRCSLSLRLPSLWRSVSQKQWITNLKRRFRCSGASRPPRMPAVACCRSQRRNPGRSRQCRRTASAWTNQRGLPLHHPPLAN
jgi:hypothetical protein